MLRLVAVLALAACGRLSFEPRSDAADLPQCTLGDWSALQHLAAASSSAIDWAATIHPDGLHIVFWSTRDGNDKLYLTSRANRDDEFGAAELITVLDSNTSETQPSWSPDGSALYFITTRDGPSNVYRAAWGGASFAPPVRMAWPGIVQPLAFDFGATENELFTVKRVNSLLELGHHTRADADAPWIEDAALDAINELPGEEAFPGYDRRTDTVYYYSGRGGIRASQRSDGRFGPEFVVSGLESTDNDDPDFTIDGTLLVLNADFTGSPDLYLSERGCQ